MTRWTCTRLRSLRRARGLGISSALAFALALAPPAVAHDRGIATADGHAAEDSVAPRTPATESLLTAETVARSSADADAAAAAVADDPGAVGQWGPVVNWPVVGIHVALMPNGKVLAYDASALDDRSYTSTSNHTFTRATVYDPATGTQTSAWVQLGYNVFCSGLAHLTDGNLFLAGGNADRYSNGIRKTHLFNYTTNGWSLGDDMEFARWYPTVTALANGEMLITGGRPWVPEIRGTDGNLRTLSQQTATMDLPLYPWMDVAPNGRVFKSGPDQTLRAIDPSGGGSWQSFGQRDSINREYGGHAMYDLGKIVVAGGGPSTKTAVTIDVNGSTPSVSATSPMAFGRRQMNLTLLADGTALATGGNSTGADLIDMNGGVYNAELWNPATGTWTTLAAESVTRQYHSSALLLPDGRVLSSGGGICDACDSVHYLGKNAQIFTPPYLFRKDGSGQLAPRPEISSAPSAVGYGAAFAITTPNAASIAKVGLIRLGAVTHSDNMEQRYVPLTFSAGSGQLSATVPQNAHRAPPGYYMLFIVDTAGVPSVAKMVNVGSSGTPPNQAPAVALTQPASGATFTAPATVSLEATASDADGTVTKVEFFNGATKLGEDTTAPYAYTWSGVAAGTYSLTARATDDDGATTASSASTITVNSGTANQPPAVTLTRPPASGATFTAPATVSLEATASDADGTVTRVEFFNGATKLGEDTTAPYAYTWSGVAAGTYSLTARATDDDGATTASSASTITVNSGTANQPPSVSITSPADGTNVTAKSRTTIAATAQDADGTVTSVKFFDGTTQIGEDTTAPYAHNWNNPAVGTHSLVAHATDNGGAVTKSAPVTVTVTKR